MDLRNLIETHLDIPRLTRDLDELGPAARRWSVLQWSSQNLALLWEATQGYRPLGVAGLLPVHAPPGGTAIHEGTSSWAAMRHFQKCFCRSEAPPDLVGYVRQPWSGVTGPGWFVARASGDEVLIDYTPRQIPLATAPTGWPHPAANNRGLRGVAFGGVVDVVRGLSEHVSLGRMQRRGEFRDLWFAMVRGEVHGGVVSAQTVGHDG